jgi:rubrerythrin
MFGDRKNRTGIASSSLADEMRASSGNLVPFASEDVFRDFRQELRRGAHAIGSLPPPASLGDAARQAIHAIQGESPPLLLDKLGERIAFERTGTRIYETLIEKLDMDGGFEGGPELGELEEIRDDELAHFRTLTSFVERLGGDPTAITPSANRAAVASMGVVQLVSDARTSLGESLEGALIAELVDHECWHALVALAEELGNDELVSFCRQAEDQEDRHLEKVRRWVRARASGAER